jgi:hypothetical protein
LSPANTSVTFTTASASTLKDHNNAALGINQLFLVYWTADASLSGFNSIDPLAPTGGDLLLVNPASAGFGYDSSAGPNIAGQLTGNASVAFTGAYEGGFVYIAMFEMAYVASPLSIAAGTYYGLGPISAALPTVPPSPAYQYGNLITAVSPLTTNLQVVPEPSTVALMLAGLGVLGFSRIRRK